MAPLGAGLRDAQAGGLQVSGLCRCARGTRGERGSCAESSGELLPACPQASATGKISASTSRKSSRRCKPVKRNRVRAVGCEANGGGHTRLTYTTCGLAEERKAAHGQRGKLQARQHGPPQPTAPAQLNLGQGARNGGGGGGKRSTTARQYK